jgi:hypothetical protein
MMLAAMLSKPTAVVLPVIALLFDLTESRRTTNWRAPMIAVLPWTGLSAACAVCARLFQTASAVPPSTPWNHLLVAADAGLFYLHKLVAPWPLAIDYGRHPQFSRDHLGITTATLSAILFIFVIAIDRITSRARPGHQHLLILAVLLAIVGLLPNSGLVSFDFQQFSTVADRYVYLAMLGPSLIVAMTLAWLAQRARTTRLTASAGCLLLLFALAALTEKQIQTWTDGTTLFHHAVAVNPNSWMSYANLAYIEADSNPEQAMADCRRSISIKDDNAIAWNTLGMLLMARGERAAAIDAFDFAHHLQPDAALFSHNAATARRQGVADR